MKLYELITGTDHDRAGKTRKGAILILLKSTFISTDP